MHPHQHPHPPVLCPALSRPILVADFSGHRPSAILFLTSNFCPSLGLRGLKCVIVPNFMAIRRTVAELWRFNDFQNDGGPPSCTVRGSICVVIQKSVAIGQIVAEIWQFFNFKSLPGDILELRCVRPSVRTSTKSFFFGFRSNLVCR